MKKLLKKMFTNFVMSEKSQTTPLIRHFVSPSPTIGEKEILCAKHTDKNLSTCCLNVLETDNTPTLSRICKFAYRSLTNFTLSQRERVKYGFTLAEVFSPCRKIKLNLGFTLAEVLITLGIIGVVAALTLPSLIQKYQEQETVTRLKNVYSTVSNAYIRILEEDGDPTNWGMNKDNFATITTEKFSKYIKKVRVCNSQSCRGGIIKARKNLVGNMTNHLQDTNILVMPNGAIIFFGYQDPTQIQNCKNLNYCFNLNVDINGNRGPNRWGYDTFTFEVNSYRIVPRGALGSRSNDTLCNPTTTSESAGWFLGSACTAWVLQNGNLDYIKCLKGKTEYCNQRYVFRY